MDRALAIFGRYPHRGKVKTRLEKEIGADRALQIYSAFLLDTLEKFLCLEVEVFLFLADSSESEAEDFKSQHGLPERLHISRQRGRDLGERMWNGYRHLQSQGFPGVVFIGSDTPTLPMGIVLQAFQILGTGSTVVGPVEDGGYYLLGLWEPRCDLFKGIDWGTERVLGQTLARLHPDEFQELPLWYDIDRKDDLQRLWEEIGQSEDPPFRTAKVLRGWSLSDQSIIFEQESRHGHESVEKK